jgi:hypothetical protein
MSLPQAGGSLARVQVLKVQQLLVSQSRSFDGLLRSVADCKPDAFSVFILGSFIAKSWLSKGQW